MKKFSVIAVDGGAGTGKSTLSNLISNRNNFFYVETGSHYRALTFMLLQKDLKPDNVEDYILKNSLSIESNINKNKCEIQIDGFKFNPEDLRSSKVNDNVSHFASLAVLRKSLLDYQRSQVNLAKSLGFSGVILEGRDIGTKILPDADLKVFLHADAETRIQRRMKDGEVDSIKKRDELDSNRKSAPLACADNALRINTADYSAEEVYNLVIEALNSRL